MRAGVRPGLQILWAFLWGADRFDSDALPPEKAVTSEQWTVNKHVGREGLTASVHCSLVTAHCFSNELKKTQSVRENYRSQASGAFASRYASSRADPPGQTKEGAQTQKAPKAGRNRN